jgi:hypothetical protein
MRHDGIPKKRASLRPGSNRELGGKLLEILIFSEVYIQS